MDHWTYQCWVRVFSVVASSILIPFSPYIAACLIGCWLTDPLNHILGRRGTLFFCGIFCTLSVIGQGVAQTWPQLLVCHMLEAASTSLLTEPPRFAACYLV